MPKLIQKKCSCEQEDGFNSLTQLKNKLVLQDNRNSTIQAKAFPLLGKPQIMQLAKYQSKSDDEFTVDVDAGASGVFAQAEKSGEEFAASSLEYSTFHYTDAKNGGTVATKVPMATQTNTMHAYPQRGGVGSLMLAEAMTYLNGRRISYFQPDAMMSSGGNAMNDMIPGTSRSAAYMEQLIEQTDKKSSGCSCWESFKGLFTCCAPKKKPQTENSRLLDDEQQDDSVSTYPAKEVDYEEAQEILSTTISNKFNRI
ncbi:hypothetical protein [Aliikangiella sp. IMCC44359]|uniref:hypothetical protein n=1 Tax=Aliikangiella sp. IMCC44359 TaxID=3459125 RepID=UPI00403A8BCD